MRVLYVGRAQTSHDRRFIRAWEATGAEVTALAAVGSPDAQRELVRAAIASSVPDLVHAGPLTTPADVVAELWDGPLVVASWGFDLLHEIVADPQLTPGAARVLERADLVFVDNAATERRAVQLGAVEHRIRRFPWGLDAWWFEPARGTRPSESSAEMIVSTRRHESIYRVADVIDGFRIAAVTNPRLRLQVVGSGSLTPELMSRAAESGVAERIEFLGDLDPHHLREVLEGAAAYVTATEVDGTSISLLEAMAVNVPVIASDIEGNREWVDADTGVLFPVGDVDTLGKLISSVTDGDGAVKARARALTAHDRVYQRANWAQTEANFSAFAGAAVENRAAVGGAESGPS
jgi:glycosyltransferase involved in cell wall biosynthesis